MEYRPKHMKPAGNAGASAAAEAAERVGSHAALISVCVMVSRITGFIRTWAMGFALGTTLLSSSYQVACNLPNQLYELVMGGMLVTAFLPVYVGLKRREGDERANRYASTLMGIVGIVLGVISLAATIWAPQVVWTQMFMSPEGSRELVVYFFRFFAIQLLFYGVSAIAGGLLNARREYFWSSAAPIANNLVVIVVMFVCVFVAPTNPELGIQVIAIGTPVGVLAQMLMQVIPMARHGVVLKPWKIDLHDPALRETLAIGVPTIIVTIGSFITVSVQNATAMSVSDAGSSVLFYARQWFTLPYAFLSVPLTTTLFTELSTLVADGDKRATLTTIMAGTRQNNYFMIPMALYLAVFSVPLVSLFCAGKFDVDSVALVAEYLAWMAISLPFYALFLYMQKVYSSLRRMGTYAVLNVVASVVQVVLTVFLCRGGLGWDGMGLPGIALAQVAFFVIGVVWCYVDLRVSQGLDGFKGMWGSAACSLVLGAVGAAVGFGVLWLIGRVWGPATTDIPHALVMVVVGGMCALLVTFGTGAALHVPESQMISRLARRLLRR